MAISKVYLNSDVQMDVTDTTATQGQVASTAYYYGADGVKKQGSYVAPSAVTQATPTISVNTSTGLITASSTQSAGVVSAGTTTATEQLTTQAAQTLYPSTTDQTISSGKYLTGTQTFKGVLLTNLTAGNIKKDVVVKVGDSADDDRITSVTGTYEGSGGGGGIEYETGSVTLVTDATQLTISFSNSHLSRPIAFMLSASEDTMSVNFNTTFIWTLLSYYDAFGLSIGGKYGRMHTIYSSSTGAAQSQGSDLTSIDGATASLAYYCDNNAITPKTGNTSRFFKAGITYDWVAVWSPTV